MKSERNFRNYLAGAALAFGTVLLTSQVLQIAYGGLGQTELDSMMSILTDTYLAAHIAGGFLGGYLVARVRRKDYIQTGTLVAVLAYIFEFVYNVLVVRMLTDIWAMLSLLIGGIVGTMFFRVRLERDKIVNLKSNETKSALPEKASGQN